MAGEETPVPNRREERIIFLRLHIELFRQHAAMFGRQGWRDLDAMYVQRAVGLGFLEGKPFTAHKIATYLGLPRTTVLRKLDMLIQEGFVERKDDGTYVNGKDYVRLPDAALSAECDAIIRAGAQLSETDKYSLDSRNKSPQVCSTTSRETRKMSYITDKLLALPPFYTATVNHWSINGFEQAVKAGSLRQCMRNAARFNDHPSEAEINVYQHVDGNEPKLVAKRRVTDRFWKYVKDN